MMLELGVSHPQTPAGYLSTEDDNFSQIVWSLIGVK